jgi:uncharacterized protein YqjF (DUF2071 family)
MVSLPARFEPSHLRRPERRWINVTTLLRDFALISYAVQPDILARYLAPGFEPDVRTLDDGSRRALISAVPFRDRDFRFEIAPWLRFAMGQTNYRAYVLYKGRRCVWFFGTSLTRPWVYAPILWWKLPWHPARMRFDAVWEGEYCRSYRLETVAQWAPVEMELEGTNRTMGRLDGFADEEETSVILTHPLTGYYYRRDGRVGSYSIWHDCLHMFHATPRRLRFGLFEELGLIGPDTPPHSTLVQREAEFVIRLPPAPLR